MKFTGTKLPGAFLLAVDRRTPDCGALGWWPLFSPSTALQDGFPAAQSVWATSRSKKAVAQLIRAVVRNVWEGARTKKTVAQLRKAVVQTNKATAQNDWAASRKKKAEPIRKFVCGSELREKSL